MEEQLAFTFDKQTASRFMEYHAANPEVYEYFKRFTFEKICSGAKSIGAKAVFERIRWESPIKTSGEEYSLNNIFTPFYARLFMKEYPQHDGLFETRRSKADVEGVTV